MVSLGEDDVVKLKENAQRIMQRIQGDYIKQYHNTHQDMANYVIQEMFLRAVGGTAEEKDSSSHYSRPRRRRAPTPGSSGDGDGGPPPVTPRDKESPENKKKLDRNYPNVSMLHEGVLSRIGKLEQEIWDLKKTPSSGGSPEETEGLSVGEMVEKLQEEVRVQGGRVKETEVAMEEARATVRGTEDALREMAALRESQAAVTELKSLVELQGKQFQEELQSMTDELAALRAEVEEGRKEKSQIEGGKRVSLHLQELIMSPESAQRNRDIVNTLNAAQV